LKKVNGVSFDNLWRWLDNGFKDGAWNMAADQYFTECMAEIRQPIMRIYQWQPWCISLGYHQKSQCLDLNRCRKSGIDVVRRQTGGRAVFHAEEIAYSVILPVGHPLATSVSQTYQQISLGLAAGIQTLGIQASFQKRQVNLKSHYKKKIASSCFSAAALHEIVVHNRKLVGSAQRRMPTGILQHGSILIGSAHQQLFRYMKQLPDREVKIMEKELSDKTTCICEWIRSVPLNATIASALKTGMAGTLGIQFEDKAITLDELQEIDILKHKFSILKGAEKADGFVINNE